MSLCAVHPKREKDESLTSSEIMLHLDLDLKESGFSLTSSGLMKVSTRVILIFIHVLLRAD